MAKTPQIQLPELAEGAAGGEVLYTRMVRMADGLFREAVVDRLATPPGGPAAGDAYIITSSPTGAWDDAVNGGAEHSLAIYDGSGWQFVLPYEGMRRWVLDEDLVYTYTGSTWRVPATVADLNQTIAGPSIAEVQAISDKVDELLAELRSQGTLA